MVPCTDRGRSVDGEGLRVALHNDRALACHTICVITGIGSESSAQKVLKSSKAHAIIAHIVMANMIIALGPFIIIIVL